MSDFAFEAREVGYSYDDVRALGAISLRIRRGERIALLGANGSGKSTLLRLLAGLCFPQRGSISFFGEPLTDERLRDDAFFFSFRRRVGLVFQNPDVQLFNPAVYDELAFGPLQLGWPKAQIRRCVEEMLEQMGIAHLRDRAPHRLSGGEKKRVALASVLILQPEVLLLDEPAAGLDPGSQGQIVNLLASWKNSGRTVITATHDMDTLEEIADRCCVFEDGRIAAEASPLDVLHDLPLLERTNLLRPHAHRHAAGMPHPHPHVHRHEPE
ncbi:MAG TPA: ABC transporter ATP-binding protein [Bryobacteraceae bacterium]|nr:ABC transporter ATP-binding protein [Bryobacteraceae bacterium]